MSYLANPAVPVQKPLKLSKWWSISFFIVAVVMFVIGGALIGTYLSNTSTCWNYYSGYNFNWDYSCASSPASDFYGAVACFIIGGTCKLVAWIFLIIFCVKRRRSIG